VVVVMMKLVVVFRAVISTPDTGAPVSLSTLPSKPCPTEADNPGEVRNGITHTRSATVSNRVAIFLI
jgi:hypothetical protein